MISPLAPGLPRKGEAYAANVFTYRGCQEAEPERAVREANPGRS